MDATPHSLPPGLWAPLPSDLCADTSWYFTALPGWWSEVLNVKIYVGHCTPRTCEWAHVAHFVPVLDFLLWLLWPALSSMRKVMCSVLPPGERQSYRPPLSHFSAWPMTHVESDPEKRNLARFRHHVSELEGPLYSPFHFFHWTEEAW